MRNMSFQKTIPQIEAELKDVTRRLNWRMLRAGMLVQAVDRCMGFKKGEHPVKLKVLLIQNTRWEPLNVITQAECVREGFPDMTPTQFIEMFREMNKCPVDQMVNRIEFSYVHQPVSKYFKVKVNIEQLSLTLSVT